MDYKALLDNVEKPFIIAIDGTSASGKGTMAKRIADTFGLDYMDTGLLYRGVGVLADSMGLDPDKSGEALKATQAMMADYPQSIEGLNLKSDKAGPLASKAAQHPAVRQMLYDFQRDFGVKATKGAVLDGRDIGTVIFPEADAKLFITADVEVRAKRRSDELAKTNPNVDYSRVLSDMIERDKRDSERAVAPLKPAGDAFILDTSDKSIQASFDAAMLHILTKLQKD